MCHGDQSIQAAGPPRATRLPETLVMYLTRDGESLLGGVGCTCTEAQRRLACFGCPAGSGGRSHTEKASTSVSGLRGKLIWPSGLKVNISAIAERDLIRAKTNFYI